jgi:hypothetical protein
MRERAKKLGGHIELWSRPKAGTEIELRVPAASIYEPRVKNPWFGWFTRDNNKSDKTAPKDE